MLYSLNRFQGCSSSNNHMECWNKINKLKNGIYSVISPSVPLICPHH